MATTSRFMNGRRIATGLVILSAAAVPAVGADLFVAGTIGEVYLGDSHEGGFVHYGGICLAPVHSLAVDETTIYAGDINGGIIRLDRATGDFLTLYWIPGSDATDIVAHDGDILVSSSSGAVDRVEPVSGQVLDTLASPIAIEAMALDGDDLYIAGTIGEVYKGDAVTGNFTLFGGICLGPVQSLALDDQFVYAGDHVGAVVRFDRETGDYDGQFFAADTITALVVDGSDVLVSFAFSGEIDRHDPMTGELMNTITAPLDVGAMEIIQPVGDIDGDFRVGTSDLLILLANWGPCDAKGACPGDVNSDGVVDTADLLELLANWTA